MCGIAGILTSRPLAERGLPLAGGGRLSPDEALERMVRHLRHRGPDDEGQIVLHSETCTVGFAHTRLAILDLSPSGHQPMPDPAMRTWITYNGEIYNHKLLRQKLERGGEPWISRSDTEVILKAYARWGQESVSHLRGMFAFAIWDWQHQVLFLARDRLGIKPLYFYRGNGFFVFASEVRALLGSGLVPRQLDPVSLSHYLAYQSVPAPRSMVAEVRALSPGSWLEVNATGKYCERQYWDLLETASTEARVASQAESRRRVGELLREVVALHLESDVAVAAFLSGGIDSSALVALMRQAGQTPRTVSVGFSETPYDEGRFARQAAAHFKTDHTEIQLKESELLDQLPDALMAMDQPTGDGVNTYIIAGAVRSRGIKVALSGLGGDEFFAGYPSFSRVAPIASWLRLWGKAPNSMRDIAAKAVEVLLGSSVRSSKTAQILRSDGTIAALFPVIRRVLSPSQRRSLLQEAWLRPPDSEEEPYVKLLQNAFAGAPWAGSLTQLSYAEARTYMHDLLLKDTDQMGMAHALEIRVPLLDHNLVEYLMGLPDSHKRANGTPKRLLVESLAGLLPDKIVYRPKQGFTLPFEPWMRGALRPFCEERLRSDRTAARGIMRPEQVRDLWRGFLASRSDVSWSRLWILVVLEEWLERNGIGACDLSRATGSFV